MSMESMLPPPFTVVVHQKLYQNGEELNHPQEGAGHTQLRHLSSLIKKAKLSGARMVFPG